MAHRETLDIETAPSEKAHSAVKYAGTILHQGYECMRHGGSSRVEAVGGREKAESRKQRAGNGKQGTGSRNG
jgi:hypothetical protein